MSKRPLCFCSAYPFPHTKGRGCHMPVPCIHAEGHMFRPGSQVCSYCGKTSEEVNLYRPFMQEDDDAPQA